MRGTNTAALALGLGLLAAAPARADRVQVFSIQDADCTECGETLGKALKAVKGVKKTSFDLRKVELTVRLAEGVTDETVIETAKAAGFTAVAGAGRGGYKPAEGYPAGADVALLSPDGRAVGSLEKLRVAGKYTVFDIYADWCGPCKLVDTRLRELLAERKDLAVRRLNVVDFDSPLSGELGPNFGALPYLVVFTPAGKRSDIEGADFARLDKALAR
jgi:thiol-disulfide isomerase/thioredoxin/copper chaperone CopZ